MDKYTKILVIIVVLIYANALFFYFGGGAILGKPKTGPSIKPILDVSQSPVLSFKDSGNTDQQQQQTTKEGYLIKEDYGGAIKIKDFIFDQNTSHIKTVLMSFKTLKIKPKDLCWQEEVTENVTIKVPHMTGFTVGNTVTDIVGGANIPVNVPSQVNDYDMGAAMNQQQLMQNTDETVERVSYYVTKCQTAQEIYLSSIFGTVDIMRNGEALATYSLTFRKEERDDKLYDYLVVEKDIYLPTDPGRYDLKVVIWDKISGNRIEHEEEFFVK